MWLSSGWDLGLANQMQGCEFWKAEVQGQASAASAGSVASLVVRMFGFSAAPLVESPRLVTCFVRIKRHGTGHSFC